MEQSWGKKEVDQILEDLRAKGDYKTRAEIKQVIREQDKELVKISANFVYLGIMCVTSIVGMVARKMTMNYLTQHFPN